jgi:hypothetical protein
MGRFERTGLQSWRDATTLGSEMEQTHKQEGKTRGFYCLPSKARQVVFIYKVRDSQCEYLMESNKECAGV